MNFKQMLVLAGLLGSASFAHAQTTAFTYQGRLNTAGGATTGLYDFGFNLYAASSGGLALTASNGFFAVPVTGGVFTVTLDFGNQFPGADRWLGIAVRTNGVGAFATLAPRQPLTSTPYAIRAANAGTAATATTASSVAAGGVNNTALANSVVDSAKIADGSIAASDLSFAVASNTFWRLTGNAGTTPGTHYIGASDSAQIRLHATGGFLVDNTTPNLSFGNQTRQMLNLWGTAYGLGVQANTLYQRSDNNFAWFRDGVHNDNGNNPGAGGTNLMLLDANGELYVNASLTLDNPNANGGTLRPGLLFGYGSGEGIASKRTAGGNQYGLDFYTGFLPRLSIANNGSIGIGTSAPEDSILDIEGDTHINDHDIFLRPGGDRNHGLGYRGSAAGQGIDGPFVYGFNGGALGVAGPDSITLRWDWQGNVWVSNNLSAASIEARDAAGNATIRLAGSGVATVRVLEITGGADIAEPFEMKEESIEPGSVVVIDEEHPGRLTRSTRPYDTRVAGIVSGANGINPGLALHQQGKLEGGQNVALTGRVYAYADAGPAPIQPGDLLTTSDTPGHVMKAIDRERGHGAILGKAMTSLKDGRGMVLVLVSLQ